MSPKYRFVLLVFCLSFLLCSAAQAGQRILAVQSQQLKPFERALSGFKEFFPADIERIVLAQMENSDIESEISKRNPDLILAIGNEALRKVRDISTIPVIYCMVLHPEKIVQGRTNIAGVSMSIAPEKQLAALVSALPGTRKIGIIYDPDNTGDFVDTVEKISSRYCCSIIAEKISHPKDAPAALLNIIDEIDIFWMMPDLSVVTPLTIDYIFDACLRKSKPVVSFAQKYVSLGAVLSIGIDAVDIGKQTAEIASTILSPKSQALAFRTAPRKPVISINSQIARKALITVNRQVAWNLGLAIDEAILQEARIVN